MKDDIPRLQAHLRRVFGADTIRIVPQPKKEDMAEVFVGDEFIATLYREVEDGEVEYHFQMCILEMDLEGAGDDA